MEINSFTSCSNYFDRLRHKTREIDEGIDKLVEIWKMPQLLVGGYAERTDETDACLEKLWDSIRSTGDEVKKLHLELNPSLDETDKLLKEFHTMYDDLKEQCDNLDIVLAEYGYCYENSNNESENYSPNDNETCTNHNLLITKQMPDIEVEFTPDLSWKSKPKSKESNSFNEDQKNQVVKGIATPVIKSLQSVLQAEIFNGNELLVNKTST